MRATKKSRLEKHGWRVGSTRDFLELSAEEASFIELKLALSRTLRARREKRHMSQAELARVIHSSQSRVAKMEAGDPSVSADLLLKALFAIGATTRQVANTISKARTSRAA